MLDFWFLETIGWSGVGLALVLQITIPCQVIYCTYIICWICSLSHFPDGTTGSRKGSSKEAQVRLVAEKGPEPNSPDTHFSWSCWKMLPLRPASPQCHVPLLGGALLVTYLSSQRANPLRTGTWRQYVGQLHGNREENSAFIPHCACFTWDWLHSRT